jgi:hypothetical protein
MENQTQPNERTSSTTWAWKMVRMRPGPDGQGTRPPKAGRWYALPWRNPREPLTVTLRYRGGPEAWVEVKARGAMGRFHGATSLFDVVRELNQWEKKQPR